MRIDADPGASALPSTNDVELIGVTKAFGATLAVRNLSLRVEPGTFLSLLGPSGCGKTTTLRLIAGFEQPTTGQVLIRGQDVAGLPPYCRDVNTVFQSYALFPHMSVADNIAYGLRRKGLSRDEVARRVAEALDLVRLPSAGKRRPAQLSGGQQQRVALARALVNRPTVLLLDEPLSALDLKLRKEMQQELKALQRTVGITFIHVTHDQEEAITLSDRIAVINAGELEQQGTPEEVYEHPQTRFVADFIGLTNFIAGHVRAAGNPLVIMTSLGDIVCSGQQPSVAAGERVTLTLRPEKLRITPEGTPCPAGWNALHGIVAQAAFLGPQNEYRVRIGAEPEASELTVRQQNLGTLGDAATVADGRGAVESDWRVFGPGERVTLQWHHEVSLVLRESGTQIESANEVGAQAPAAHAARG